MMRFAVVRPCAVKQEMVGIRRPIDARFVQRFQQLQRRRRIRAAFVPAGGLGDFDEPAGRDGRGRIVRQPRLRRLPEIDRDDAVLRNARHKIMSNPLGRLQILVFSGMNMAHHKTVERPGLPARPGGAFSVALAAMRPNHASVEWIKFDDMVDGAVGTDKRRHGRICVLHGDLLETRVPVSSVAQYSKGMLSMQSMIAQPRVSPSSRSFHARMKPPPN